MVFLSLFYHLRNYGLHVSANEWISLLEALDKGLARSSLLEFYHLSRSVLVKSEADFDKFDVAFLAYFQSMQDTTGIPEELLQYLSRPVEQQDYDKDEVDARTNMEYEQLQDLLRQRIREQVGAHNGGKRWIGTGGTSPLGNSGYSYTGIRVGGTGANRSALQVAADRGFRDFREDETVHLRQFQTAFRRLRQISGRSDGRKTELDLDATITKTCENAGYLKLAFRPPRRNAVKLLVLFDSGGSMEPYAQLCSQLFQAVSKANHFSKLKIYYFHNCPYNRTYKTPACIYPESVDTQWLLDQLTSDYKVIFVGDASMAPWEMRYYVGGREGRPGDPVSGLSWLHKFIEKCGHAIWLNPIPEDAWEAVKGRETIARIRSELPMYPLSVQGIDRGIRRLLSVR